MSRSAWCLTAALLLGLASIIVTRVFRAFTVAEVLAILAFISGLAIFWLSRVDADDKSLPWPHRLVIAGSVIGIVGLLIKAVFVVFRVAHWDDLLCGAKHPGAPGNPGIPRP